MNRVGKILGIVLVGLLTLLGCVQTINQDTADLPTNSSEIYEAKEVYPILEENMKDEPEEEIIPEDENQAIVPGEFDLSIISYKIEASPEYTEGIEQVFPKVYTNIEGVLTFRGNNFRDTASYGLVDIQENQLEAAWEFMTGSRSWGGGAGWTGQAAIIKWPEETKKIMNIKDEFIEKEDFIEAVCPSLEGKVYFFELESGKQTREPIDIKNPIKGAVALDPRGYPILYVGQGISETGEFGYRIFSLIDGKQIFFINGKDAFSYRSWGAFDGAPVINSDTDTLVIGGENGLFYNVKLNTNFDMDNKSIEVKPELVKYRYKVRGNDYQGIENSIAAYKNLAYFADNGGSIQAVDLNSMKPVWCLEKLDDTDATITIGLEDNTPYLYTGTEVDKQGIEGNAHLRKINGITGEVVWKKEYHCISTQGEKPINAGLFATNIIGKNEIADIVVFTLARYDTFNAGLMLALDKKTGDEVWRWEMPDYAWSSPAAIYNSEGKAYIIQCDSTGSIFLLEGKTGSILSQINIGANIESSPAIFNDILVIATRGGKIFGIKIK